MKTKIAATILSLTAPVMATEIGLKVGGASIKLKDVEEAINLTTFLSIYLDIDVPVGPTFSVGPSFELGSGSLDLESATCIGYGTCSIKFTYSTLEANAKAKLKLMIAQLFGGAGVSLNRFGIDAFDSSNNKIGTLGEVTATGVQFFGGGLLTFGAFGVGAEVKVKSLTLPDVRYVTHYTINLALTF